VQQDDIIAERKTMRTETIEVTAEAQIAALIDDRAKAARAMDIGGVVSHYAPDIVALLPQDERPVDDRA
jgi:ketosteroid isomerase-like protein